MLSAIFLLFAEIILGSWNLKWFPSGRAEHRASVRVEAANCADAAEVIREDVGKGKSILFFQELRDALATSNLVACVNRPGMKPAITSAFMTGDRRLDWQQCAIATDYPVIEAKWDYWKETWGGGRRTKKAPRGYVYALVDCGTDGLVACWCVHLKSNYGATSDDKRADNIKKREMAVRELVELMKSARSPDGRPITCHVVAGDFNTDPFGGEFDDEETTRILEKAGFYNCFKNLPLSERGTHPGNTRYPDSTIDFFFYKGLKGGKPRLSKEIPLSDHRMIWLKLGKSDDTTIGDSFAAEKPPLTGGGHF